MLLRLQYTESGFRYRAGRITSQHAAVSPSDQAVSKTLEIVGPESQPPPPKLCSLETIIKMACRKTTNHSRGVLFESICMLNRLLQEKLCFKTFESGQAPGLELKHDLSDRPRCPAMALHGELRKVFWTASVIILLSSLLFF